MPTVPIDWLLLSMQAGVLLFLAGLAGVSWYLKGGDAPAPAAVAKAKPFSDLYPLEGGSPIEETLANLALVQVEDDVPDSGRVVLRRAGVGEFEYWADRSVHYANLEALARKWTIVYQEPETYLARKRVLEARPAPDRPVDKDSVFAPLKTYAAPTVVKVEQANVYRWRGRVREVPVPKNEEKPKELRYSDFKKNV
jgi:hypothetical protein